MSGEYTTPPGELNYDHNRLYSLTAAGEKGTALRLESFRGRLSFGVFQDNKPPVKIQLPQGMTTVIVYALEKLLDGGPNATPIKISLSKFDIQTKTSTPDGDIVIGRDEKNMLYIGVWKPGVGADGKLKFPLRLPLSFDVSADIDAVQQSVLAARDLITTLNHDARVAAVVSSFKRKMPPGGGGGNRFGSNARGGTSSAAVDDEIRW